MDVALEIMSKTKPDVFNHNLETVPRLYKQCRPGSDYEWSLTLLKRYKELNPDVITKSGLMLGLGESNEEIIEVIDRKSTRLNSSHVRISYAVFCLKKKTKKL